jgi:hypothetical protein
MHNIRENDIVRSNTLIAPASAKLHSYRHSFLRHGHHVKIYLGLQIERDTVPASLLR